MEYTKLAIEDILAVADPTAEVPNLVGQLNLDELEEMARDIREAVDVDTRSRKIWEENQDRWTNLALQVTEKKNYPWPDASNVHYPLVSTVATQFAARAYSALLPGVNLVRGRVVGADADGEKRKRGIRIEQHMSYQLLEEMEEWEEHEDRLLHVLPITGTAFKKTYYSPSLNRNMSTLVMPKDLIVNYNAESLEQAPRKTHLLNYTGNELEEMYRQGIFARPPVEKELEPTPSLQAKTNADKSQEMSPQVDDSIDMHEVYECHCSWDLDGDGYQEPYIISIHKNSDHVFRIYPRFQEDAIDVNEYSEEITKITPDEYFTGFIFLPDPNSGVYGLGYGHLLGPMNESVNTIINQLVDAGTLSNTQGGFLSKNLQMKGGKVPFGPGEWRIVNAFSDDLRKGIVPLPVGEPSSTLFSLLSMMIDSGMKLASVADVMTGDIPGQNTKATVAMAAIEQGMKVFTSIYKRIHRSFKKELRKIAKLNALYMDDEKYYSIVDAPELMNGAEGEEGAEQQGKVARKDYELNDNDIIPYSDPNVSSEQQRLLKVQALGELLSLGTINPVEYTRRFCEATDQPGITKLMDVEPQGPDPEVVLKQQEFAHRVQMDLWDRKLKAFEFELKSLKEQSAAILNMAKAEAAEEGSQLAMYETTMNQLREDEKLVLEGYIKLLEQPPQEANSGARTDSSKQAAA